MIRKALITAISVLALGRLATAATIDTPTMHYGGDDIACLVLNSSDKDISGTQSFFNHAGVLVFSFGNLDVGAGRVGGFGLSAAQAGTQGFCRFEGKFSKKVVKLTLCARNNGLSCTAAVHSD